MEPEDSSEEFTNGSVYSNQSARVLGDHFSTGDLLSHSQLLLNVSDAFWTPYQKFLIKSVPWRLHVALGIVVALIGLLGIIANSTVLLIFAKFKKLRTPANIFVINLAISDLGASLLHPLAAYSSFCGRWAFGKAACEIYALGVGFFGLNSIVTLTAVATERCLVITSQSLKWRISRAQAKKICLLIWIHCLALVIPPMLGWSSYVPEGLLTTCSWDYTTRTLSNRLYYLYLLFFGFLLPVIVIVGCYLTILFVVTHQGREITQMATPSQKTYFHNRRLETDMRTAHVIITIVILYLITWTPYAVVSFIGQFGQPHVLTPFSTALPAFFAKGAVVFDPLVYGFSHPHFRLTFHQYLRSFSGGSSNVLPQQRQDDAVRGPTSSGNSPVGTSQVRGSSPQPLIRYGRKTRHPSSRSQAYKGQQGLQENGIKRSKSLWKCSEKSRIQRGRGFFLSEPDLTITKRTGKRIMVAVQVDQNGRERSFIYTEN